MRLEVAVMEKGRMGPKLQTRVFEAGKEKRVSLAALAMAMGISLSQLYRVRQGKRSIAEKGSDLGKKDTGRQRTRLKGCGESQSNDTTITRT